MKNLFIKLTISASILLLLSGCSATVNASANALDDQFSRISGVSDVKVRHGLVGAFPTPHAHLVIQVDEKLPAAKIENILLQVATVMETKDDSVSAGVLYRNVSLPMGTPLNIIEAIHAITENPLKAGINNYTSGSINPKAWDGSEQEAVTEVTFNVKDKKNLIENLKRMGDFKYPDNIEVRLESTDKTRSSIAVSNKSAVELANSLMPVALTGKNRIVITSTNVLVELQKANSSEEEINNVQSKLEKYAATHLSENVYMLFTVDNEITWRNN